MSLEFKPSKIFIQKFSVDLFQGKSLLNSNIWKNQLRERIVVHHCNTPFVCSFNHCLCVLSISRMVAVEEQATDIFEKYNILI